MKDFARGHVFMAVDYDLLLESPYEVEAEICRRSMRDYLELCWHILEPSHPFVPGWHIDAICDHLEATIGPDASIRRLLINIPPRCTKSLLSAVGFPTWAWTKDPTARFLYSSYAEKLATRDAVKSRRIIQSPWYRARFGREFNLAFDQNLKTRYDNDKTGYRISTSVGAATTGEGGDILCCFPAESKVWTGAGHVPIGDIVRQRMPLEIPSLNTATGRIERKPITGWHKNPARDLVEVEFSDGSRQRCTPCHRFWTLNAGMVRADSLRPWHMLPSDPVADLRDGFPVDAESFRDLPVTGFRADDSPHLIDGEFPGHETPVGIFAESIGNVRPYPTDSNVTDCRFGHAVNLAQFAGFERAGDNLQDFRFGEFRAGAILVNRESPVFLRIVDILRASPVFEIPNGVVLAIAVQVAHLLAVGNRADKRERDALVYAHGNRPSVSPGVEAKVIIRAGASFEKLVGDRQILPVPLHGSPVATNATIIGNAVKSLKSRYRTPIFVRAAGHVESTYCLTVQDNHTFYVGENNSVVANCDDPHNVRDAESDAVREETINWWMEAMSNRHNDPKTGVSIIVCQRTHMRDLSAAVLANGGWDHLEIPMEYDPKRSKVTSLGWTDPREKAGELMQPERFGPAERDDRKREMGPVAYGAQYDQNPVVRGGSFFQTDWFSFYDRFGDSYRLYPYRNPLVPRLVRVRDCIRIVTIDTASTKDTSNDPTAIGVFDVTPNGDLILLTMERKFLTVPEVRAAVVRISKLWNPVYVAIEFAASGIGVVQDLQQSGLSIKPLSVTTVVEREDGLKSSLGDKVSRATVAMVRMAGEQIFFPAGRPEPWWDDFEKELIAFSPLGAHEHDDQVDVLAYASIEAYQMQMSGIRKSGDDLPTGAFYDTYR